MALHVRILTHADKLREIAGDWAALADAVGEPAPAAWPEWAAAWLSVQGGPVPLRAFALFDAEALAGLALLAADADGRLAGLAADLNDHAPVLLSPRVAADGAGVLAEAIVSHAPGGVELRLADDRVSPLLDALATLAPVTQQRARATPTAHLPAGWGAFEATLSPDRRRRLAYYLRRLEREGRVEGEWIGAGPALVPAVAQLLCDRRAGLQTRGRLAGFAPVTTAETYDRFLLQVAALSGRQRGAAVWRLTLDGEAAASVLLLRAGPSALMYTLGWNPALARLNVGTAAVWTAMRAAAERGVTRFDFGLGSEPYKAALGAAPDRRTDWTFGPPQPPFGSA